MSDVESGASGVVMNPGDLKSDLFAGLVFSEQGKEICALDHVLVESKRKAPAQAPHFVVGPSPFTTQQVRCGFHQASRQRIEARTCLSLERDLFVELSRQIQVGQSEERVRQIHGDGVASDHMMVVHHIAETNFTGISQARLCVDLSVVGLIERRPEGVVQLGLKLIKGVIEAVIFGDEPGVVAQLLLGCVFGRRVFDSRLVAFDVERVLSEVNLVGGPLP